MSAVVIDKDLAVIGSGWSGIYALKYATEYGLDAISIDKRENVGGLWAYSDDTKITTVADITLTSSPKLFTEATDFPWPEEVGLYANHKDIFDWLNAYVDHFKLREKFKLETNVKKVEKIDDKWVITATDLKTNTEIEIRSRYLIVSTGVNSEVNKISENDKRYESFTGTILHSNDIRSVLNEQKKFENKNVVSIGGGENAADMGYYFSQVTKSFHMCVPNGQWMQNRTNATKYKPIHELYPVTKEKIHPASPWEYQKCAFRNFIRPLWGSNGWDKYLTFAFNGIYGHGVPEWAPIGPIYGNFGNKADLIQHALASKKVIGKRDILKVKGKKVTFTDGFEQDDVDIILLGTGYKVGFPFLPKEFQPKSIRQMYKNIFNVEDPTLAFIGFSRPTQGSIPQLAELASIFAAKVFSGLIELPEKKEMCLIAENEKKDWEIFFRYSTGRVTGLVDGLMYNQILLKAMNLPNPYIYVLQEFGLKTYLQWLFSPCTAHTFIGLIPEKREILRKYVQENNYYNTFQHIIPMNFLFGLYDFFFYQIGRIENFLYEIFHKPTRDRVKNNFLKESKIEKWWLTVFWNKFCLIGLISFFFGGFSYFKKVLMFLGIFMVFIHLITVCLITYGKTTSKKFYGSEKFNVDESMKKTN